ncbi:hypothetical protein [Streptomyces clavuligerus]|uniref:hypothetical protein n=1 Tax=Streptomyces clavuligerus TaxID=1901 RepID=UPI0012FEEA22|nr:hypothetical protein [Streptomyces clavuligerus]MBY6301756.1 hypothetical protein [Streptomyces clavuligerus]QPJ95932.1 hypothetical protein GE265_24740 [Streptomyces clavuligerus]QPL62014.1 hypothetical protein I3J04_03560 [Streptomyces clavuligerus]QPL68047.1 hypothetical protein I3J05_03575 [Streptomyces clavuligerus]QPL73471.1 hypothetical protein I3J05_31185 [Streptomyces clavuligerus]
MGSLLNDGKGAEAERVAAPAGRADVRKRQRQQGNARLRRTAVSTTMRAILGPRRPTG